MVHSTPSSQTSAVLAGVRFDWAAVVLSAWLIGGIHLDAWAHHRFDETLETFFTPWHGVLYSGFMALALLLVATLLVNLRQGRSWRQAVPAGYGLSLLGIPILGFLAQTPEKVHSGRGRRF